MARRVLRFEGRGRRHEKRGRGAEDAATGLELVPAPPVLRSEYLDHGDRLWTAGRADEALAAYEDGIGHDVDSQLLHKRVVALVDATRGREALFAHYGLERLDDREIAIDPGEILCCMTVREEADRLPFFLEYHKRLGVDRFLVVDNGSRDATCDLLLGDPATHLWRTAMNYRRANYGTAWIEVLAHSFGCDHWCLVADPDEFLYYPDVETRSLHDLCADLDRAGKVAMPVVLLDMYRDGPVREAVCRPGEDLRAVCSFFDRRFFHSRHEATGPWANCEGFHGGVRRRVFGEGNDPFLTKVPLFRYSDARVIGGGVHSTDADPQQIASERGALLHFKFTARFVERVEDEIRRRSDWNDLSESYLDYARTLTREPDLILWDLESSVRLGDSRQLVELGIMQLADEGTRPTRVG